MNSIRTICFPDRLVKKSFLKFIPNLNMCISIFLTMNLAVLKKKLDIIS